MLSSPDEGLHSSTLHRRRLYLRSCAMEYQAAASPTQHYDHQWYQWHRSPDSYQHPSFRNPNDPTGTPEQSLHPYWHQHHESYDYGSNWTPQTPLTASASSPTSLSRTILWPTFPPPSTWTSPLTSPGCGLSQFTTCSTVTSGDISI